MKGSQGVTFVIYGIIIFRETKSIPRIIGIKTRKTLESSHNNKMIIIKSKLYVFISVVATILNCKKV